MLADEIKQLIESDIPECQVWIEGDDGVHFQAIIVAPEFSGRSTIQQHQRVYQALGNKMGNEIHALSMKTLTPEEWQQYQKDRS